MVNIPWMTEEARLKAEKSYCKPGQSVHERFVEMAGAAAKYYGNAPQVFDGILCLLVEGILSPSTPVWANFGREKNLPISCFGSYVPDSIPGIFDFQLEAAMLSKNGGGTSCYMGDVRPRGTPISSGGTSDGTVQWLEINRTRVSKISQGGVRRGAEAAYIEFSSPDLEEVLVWKKTAPDYNIGVNVRDVDLEKLKAGNATAIRKWQLILKTRLEEGEPYLVFPDKATRLSPGQKPINNSNLCTEIFLPNNDQETFVCCLSSLNAVHYDRWEETNAVFYSVLFLDAVMQEFIDKATEQPGLEKAVRFASRYRALGLGLLGLHTAFQKRGLPFDSIEAMSLSTQMTKYMQEKSYKASEYLGSLKGLPEECVDISRRNYTTMAIAPNVNSAFLCGEVSRGIEPLMANVSVHVQDKKTIIRKNYELETVLEGLGKNTPEVWLQIANDNGSVRNLDFLTADQKAVFQTAVEIDQSMLLRMANARGKYIDQGQSLNLFITKDYSPQEIHELHKLAAELPYIKGIYYCRSEKGVRAEGCEVCAS